MRKDYYYYTTEEFFWDESFRNWILYQQKEATDFWVKWMKDNPEKKETLEFAAQLVKEMTVDHEFLLKEDIAEIQKNVSDAIIHMQEDEKVDFSSGSPKKSGNLLFLAFSIKKYSIAAAFILLAGISVFLGDKSFRNAIGRNLTYRELIYKSGESLLEKVNNTNGLLKVALSDGSVITLEKNARISYPANYVGQPQREVFLNGTAFFEITKNPSRPFVVYAHGLVTKVLGTSFRISCNDNTNSVSVEVKTGKVSVFSYLDAEAKKKIKSPGFTNSTTLLTPNQKAEYYTDNQRIVKELVQEPLLIEGKVKINYNRYFNFSDTPLKEVFTALKDAYGIEILYDETYFDKLTLTALLNEGSLYDKLTLICKAINANYEVTDGQIVITNK